MLGPELGQTNLGQMGKILCLGEYKLRAGWGDISGSTSTTSRTRLPMVSWSFLSFSSISSNNTSAAPLVVWAEISPAQAVIKFSYVFIRYQMWWKKVTSPGKYCMGCGDGLLMYWGRQSVCKCNDLLMPWCKYWDPDLFLSFFFFSPKIKMYLRGV